MIRIGRMTDYGILIMTHLADDPKPVHSAHEISVALNVAAPTVMKLVKLLVHAQLLVSRRGAKGGYALALPAQSISINDIIAALEGPVGLTECGTVAQPGQCHIENACQLRGNWQRISQVVQNALANVSLAEMSHPLSQPIEWFDHSVHQGVL
jgi:FeS assembly SUF system regulator